jgi:transposase-like protein
LFWPCWPFKSKSRLEAENEFSVHAEGAKEDKSGWSAFLRHLVDRGLRGVQLVISDACRGFVESVADFLPEARYQRCMVHFYRNVFSHVPSTREHNCKLAPRRTDEQAPP